LSVSKAPAVIQIAWIGHDKIGGAPLARTNFKFEKRQKELAKQKKNEEKRLRKLGLLDENEDEAPLSEADEVANWLSK
jgi:hypothetical protein